MHESTKVQVSCDDARTKGEIRGVTSPYVVKTLRSDVLRIAVVYSIRSSPTISPDLNIAGHPLFISSIFQNESIIDLVRPMKSSNSLIKIAGEECGHLSLNRRFHFPASERVPTSVVRIVPTLLLISLARDSLPTSTLPRIQESYPLLTSTGHRPSFSLCGSRRSA